MKRQFIPVTGLGQDSHRLELNQNKKLMIGGIPFESEYALQGNSDGDVVLHALTNAISSITGVNIIGEYSDKLCTDKGITDSAVYLEHALGFLKGTKLNHVAISIECSYPKISPSIDKMKSRIAELLGINKDCVGITATSGEGLTEFGRRNGIQTFVILSADKSNGI